MKTLKSIALAVSVLLGVAATTHVIAAPTQKPTPTRVTIGPGHKHYQQIMEHLAKMRADRKAAKASKKKASATTATSTTTTTTLMAASTMSAGDGCMEENAEGCSTSEWDMYYDPNTQTTVYVEVAQLPRVEVFGYSASWSFLMDGNWNPHPMLEYDSNVFEFVENLVSPPTIVLPKTVNACAQKGALKNTTSKDSIEDIREAAGEALSGAILSTPSRAIYPYQYLSAQDKDDLVLQRIKNGLTEVTLADGGMVKVSIDPGYDADVNGVRTYRPGAWYGITTGTLTTGTGVSNCN